MNTFQRIRLIDLLSGKSILPLYRQYAATQWYGPAEVETFQVRKLRGLLAYCRRYVPFYRRALGTLRPESVDTLRVLEDLPVMDKTAVKRHYRELLPEPNGALRGVRHGTTGGTTGEPLKIFTDAATRSSVWAVYYRYLDWMGTGLHEKKFHVWGARIIDPGPIARLRKGLLHRLEGNVRLDAFDLGDDRVPWLAGMFRRYRPAAVRGYCQSLYEMACLFERHGFTFPLKAVSTTVEPLFDEYREQFRRIFGCEAFDQYGCGEVQSVAFECPAHRGLHVAFERCVVTAGDGGRVRLTDLDNRAFPVINYHNGDLADLDDTPCTCGRGGIRISRIRGRDGDVVSGADGTRLHPEYFTHLINEAGVAADRNVRRYQVRQAADGSLRWLVACDALTDKERTLLVDTVSRRLGGNAVSLETVDDIPAAASGKFRYVVSDMAREDA